MPGLAAEVAVSAEALRDDADRDARTASRPVRRYRARVVAHHTHDTECRDTDSGAKGRNGRDADDAAGRHAWRRRSG